MKSEANTDARRHILVVLLACVVALAVPAIASAQDPAGDQYAPATPNGGGDYDFNPTPTPDPTDSPGAGPESSGGGTTDSGGTTVTPEDGAATVPGDATGSHNGNGNGHGNRDQRTVEQLGANGAAERDAALAATGGADAQLASSDASTSAGLGTALWVLIGAALIWAIAMGVINFRRRDDDGDSGSSSRSTSGGRGRNENGHQPA